MRPHFCESPFYREKVASLTESPPFEFARPHFRTLSAFPNFSAEISVQIRFEIGFQHFIISIFRDENWVFQNQMLPRSTRKTLKIVCSFCSNFPFLSIHQNITTFEIILHGILHGKFWKENMLFPKGEFGSPFSSRSGKTPDLAWGKRPHFCEFPFYREKVASPKLLRSPFLRIPILSRMYCSAILLVISLDFLEISCHIRVKLLLPNLSD